MLPFTWWSSLKDDFVYMLVQFARCFGLHAECFDGHIGPLFWMAWLHVGSVYRMVWFTCWLSLQDGLVHMLDALIDMLVHFTG